MAHLLARDAVRGCRRGAAALQTRRGSLGPFGRDLGRGLGFGLRRESGKNGDGGAVGLELDALGVRCPAHVQILWARRESGRRGRGRVRWVVRRSKPPSVRGKGERRASTSWRGRGVARAGLLPRSRCRTWCRSIRGPSWVRCSARASWACCSACVGRVNATESANALARGNASDLNRVVARYPLSAAPASFGGARRGPSPAGGLWCRGWEAAWRRDGEVARRGSGRGAGHDKRRVVDPYAKPYLMSGLPFRSASQWKPG